MGRRISLDQATFSGHAVHKATACSAHHSTGGIFAVCIKKPVSFLRLKPAVPSPGKDSVTVPVITRTEFALAPPREEDDQRDVAMKSWEGEFQSVTEFLAIRKSKNLPMPAVSVHGAH